MRCWTPRAACCGMRVAGGEQSEQQQAVGGRGCSGKEERHTQTEAGSSQRAGRGYGDIRHADQHQHRANSCAKLARGLSPAPADAAVREPPSACPLRSDSNPQRELAAAVNVNKGQVGRLYGGRALAKALSWRWMSPARWSKTTYIGSG